MKKPTTGSDKVLRPDLCIIGGGAAGRSIAAAGALLNIPVVLVAGVASGTEEFDLAAAALVAAASRADAVREASRFGIGAQDAEAIIDFAAVRSHVRKAVAAQAPMKSLDRYRAMGVTVIEGEAHFVDPHTVQAGTQTIRARRFIIATGSQPLLPTIAGLETIPMQTEETILDLDEEPHHLLVLGGGASGVSLAQAFRRLGARVTLIAREDRILIAEDPEITAVVERCLRAEGIECRLGSDIAGVERGEEGRIVARFAAEGEPPITASHLLVLGERAPSLDGLRLDAGRIDLGAGGIIVDRHMRSTNSRVYAVGSSTGVAFGDITHVSTRQAEVAFRNAVLRLPGRFDSLLVPRIVHCDPEMASVGLTEGQARERSLTFRILRAPFSDNDRAVAENAKQGYVKALVTPGGKILGCSIVGPRAHDLIMPWVLAMTKGLSVSNLAELAWPHPGYSEVIGSAAVEFVQLSAQNPWLRHFIGFVRRWG